MNHELSPKPEEIYANYTNAFVALKDMEQVLEDEKDIIFSGELDEILHRAAQRTRGHDLAARRLKQAERGAQDYAIQNLPQLIEQATQEDIRRQNG